MESKRTPRRVAVIVSMLRQGCTHRAAYGLAHISRDTFYEWMKDPDFADKVRHAEAEAEAEWLKKALEDAKSPDRIKLLSMRFRDDWGERIELEHSGRVVVEYVNSWRAGDTSDAPSGATTSTL